MQASDFSKADISLGKPGIPQKFENVLLEVLAILDKPLLGMNFSISQIDGTDEIELLVTDGGSTDITSEVTCRVGHVLQTGIIRTGDKTL